MKSPRLIYHRQIANIRNNRLLARYTHPTDHPMLSSTPVEARKAVLSRCFYLPKHRLYFARIPKNANSTITKTLAAHAGLRWQDEEGRLAKNIFNRIPSAELFNSAKKVVFLRDPVVRSISAWKDKGFAKAFLRRFEFAGDETTPPDFLQFVKSLNSNHYFNNPHFLPQVQLIPGDLSDYKIYVIEDLETGLREVCQDVFGHFDGLEQRQSGRTGAKSQRDSLSNAEMAMIQKLYSDDLALYASVTGQTG